MGKIPVGPTAKMAVLHGGLAELGPPCSRSAE